MTTLGSIGGKDASLFLPPAGPLRVSSPLRIVLKYAAKDLMGTISIFGKLFALLVLKPKCNNDEKFIIIWNHLIFRRM